MIGAVQVVCLAQRDKQYPMVSLPPDDCGIDDFGLSLNPPKPPESPKPKSPKVKAAAKKFKAKASPKQKVKKTPKPVAVEEGSGSLGSKKPKTEAGQDYLHHASTIVGQYLCCQEC